jgi:hypothetical protein
MLSITLNTEPREPDRQLDMLVRERAEEWFGTAAPDSGPAHACVVSRSRRKVSVISRVQVTAGGSEHYLVAKQYRDWRCQVSPNAQRKELSRPRLFPLCDVQDKAPFEYAALSAIHQHFHGLADPRFGAVRPLAVVPQDRTIVMEDARSTNLARLLERCHRFAFRDKPRRIQKAIRNAGAWLRRYHGLSPLSHTQIRHADREEFLDSVERIGSFLIGAVGYDELLRAAIGQVAVVAHAELPAQLPLGLSHTDFAPRNVLVDATGSIAVIDTLGRWQAPIYEDAGYFLMALRTGGLQMYLQGWWLSERLLNEFEQAFLEGYFGDALPSRQAVRLFEVQSLLYRWVSISHGAHESMGIRRLGKRCRLTATNRFLANELKRLMRELVQ